MGRSTEGRWLKEVRKRRKLTRQQLAKRTGLSRERIRQLEKGGWPTMDEFFALCTVVEFTILTYRTPEKGLHLLNVVDGLEDRQFLVRIR